MEITARVTADAVVHKVNSDKEVVNFSIAINDSYKPKGSTEVIEVTSIVRIGSIQKQHNGLRKVQSYNCLDVSAATTKAKQWVALRFIVTALKF